MEYGWFAITQGLEVVHIRSEGLSLFWMVPVAVASARVAPPVGLLKVTVKVRLVLSAVFWGAQMVIVWEAVAAEKNKVPLVAM